MAHSIDTGSAFDGGADCFNQWFGDCSIYLYLVLTEYQMTEGILGISAYYHDSAAALLIDGKIAAAAQEERFTRKKHDSSFPGHAVQYVLGESGITADDVVAVAFYDKPFLKFERLLETYHSF